jgi:hypothetical protein
VDRRVVTATVETIDKNPELKAFFDRLLPTCHLRDVAPLMNWGAIEIVPANASKPGILAGVAAIIAEASLSFLGLGVTEPTPAWGLMLSGTSADFYQTAPWMILFPGLAITLAVFAFNLFGDSLRDWLNPKLKS